MQDLKVGDIVEAEYNGCLYTGVVEDLVHDPMDRIPDTAHVRLNKLFGAIVTLPVARLHPRMLFDIQPQEHSDA